MNRRLFWMVLLIPIVLLLSTIIQPLWIQASGDLITLQTTPSGDRDLFRGNYLDLQLAIDYIDASQFDRELIANMKNKDWNRVLPVYVLLKPQGRVYVVEHVSEKRPDTGIYLKAGVHPDWDQKQYQMEYPWTRFYLNKKRRNELEKTKTLIAYVKVKKGDAVIIDVKP